MTLNKVCLETVVVPLTDSPFKMVLLGRAHVTGSAHPIGQSPSLYFRK